jgi:hypothetical protein
LGVKAHLFHLFQRVGGEVGEVEGAKKKAQVFAALRGALPDWLKPFITDEVLDSVIEKAVGLMKKALAEKKPAIGK